MFGKIKIEAFPNGAHDNLLEEAPSALEPGWAAMNTVPDTLPNFPFGNFEVEEVDGELSMVANSWSPLPLPDTPEEDVPEDVPTGDTDMWEELDAAYQEGVNGAYDS